MNLRSLSPSTFRRAAMVLAFSSLGCGPNSAPEAAAPTESVPPSTVSSDEPSADANTSEGAPSATSAPVDEPPLAVEAGPPPPLPEGTVVLHVGSSTAGALGLELKKELESRGVKCVLRAKESTYIPEWAGEKMGLRSLLAQYKPDLVIVSLGGNEVEITDPTRRIKPIERLVAMIGDRPCVWVGTPRWKRLHHTGLMEVIRDHSAPCRFVDSDELIPNMETVKDGVHPTMPERKRWAQRMIQWLEVNREPNGEKPWSFKAELTIPPAPAASGEESGKAP